MYVVYASLARRKSNAYPRRSGIADALPWGSREDKAEFWECFITVGLSMVEVCKEVGITPAGFYNLQTKEYYSAYQMEFSQQVVSVYSSYRQLKQGSMGRIPNPKIISMLSIYEIESGASLVKWKKELEKNDDNQSRNPAIRWHQAHSFAWMRPMSLPNIKYGFIGKSHHCIHIYARRVNE